MGRPKRRRSDRAGRPAMRSPGRPPGWRREHRQRFWAAIARGATSEAAACRRASRRRLASDGSGRVAGCRRSPRRRCRDATCRSPSGRRSLSCELAAAGSGRSRGGSAARRRRSVASCVVTLRRAVVVLSIGRARRSGTRIGARRPKAARLAVNAELRRYVQDRLSGAVERPDGGAVDGPDVRWIGRRHGRRKDRRRAKSWSPEQISNRLVDFPDDESMRISHEAIYQSLYVQGRGALRRELTACLRTGRALRVPRARVQGRGKPFVTDQVLISERPAEAEDRAVPGHWEGDLILGLESSAIGTLVERTTRFTMLLHLPPMTDQGPRVKNGPALAGHGAEAVCDAIASTITKLLEQLRRSLTWTRAPRWPN